MDLTIAFVGLVAGFIGSFISGAQSLTALSSLLALGIPAHLAFSIHRFGGIGFMGGGLLRYFKSGHVVWKYVLPITLLSALGTGIGTRLVLEINEDILTKVVGIAMLIFIPITLWKRDLGVVKATVSRAKERIGYLTYFLLKIWGGIFPFGVGVFLTYNYLYFWGVTLLEARGTSRIPGIAGTLTAAAVFILSGVVDWGLGLTFLVANFVGAFLGAHYAIKAGNKILQYLVMASIAFLVLKTLIF